ncbi:sigma-70 family RNA polymerase sigma factor [uncultured Chryseobacterium sp.]|uniref:RNA polymerase sigma factor n=1 Tax=uncultured Chryseobacterium sp. TaxID=259322 RepID=UPI0025E96ADF|nr:sigma-70 family RNA polymerase sigma factor [uncultured Chryseobacterium sp.]
MSTINWQHIYQDYSPKLLGICRRYIQDISTAEDIVQDSFITALQKNAQLNDEKALLAWLKKIVVNNALQHIRKHSRDSFVAAESSEIPDPYSEMDHSFHEEKNIFIYDFTHEQLLSSIDSLPPHHRSVFNLYFIENHSHAEISGLLGITVNTSKSHLLRAKKSIQNYLLNNFLQQNTPKKKMARLLVLFGMGGLLWAQTFRSKFADFKIPPSRNFEIPPYNTGQISIMPSDHSLKRKIIISGTLLFIILTSVFFLRKGKGWSTANGSAGPSGPAKETRYPTGNHQSDRNRPEIYTANNQPAPDAKETPVKSKEPRSLREIPAAGEKLENRLNLKKTAIEDSVAEVPQKVMVIKKIIKRDTIFVEK